LSDEKISENESDDYLDEKVRKETKCKIFLGYTSNLVSCGIRDIVRYLVEHKKIDVIVTTGL
jgi:deoxyhypusine synthase